MQIKNGYVIAEMTTSHERISQFKSGLEATGIPFEVLSVRQTESPIEILTDRQREFVTAALEYGYYDTPRRCTLTELADELNVSTATASNVLHRTEEKIIKEFFADVSVPVTEE